MTGPVGKGGQNRNADIEALRNDLGLVQLELDNHIDGLRIQKETGPNWWSEDDEKVLQLMLRIKDILANIQPVTKGEDSE